MFYSLFQESFLQLQTLVFIHFLCFGSLLQKDLVCLFSISVSFSQICPDFQAQKLRLGLQLSAYLLAVVLGKSIDLLVFQFPPVKLG